MQQDTFCGHAFHDELPKGKSSGELALSSTALIFTGGGKMTSLPLDSIQLTLGGASNRLAYFKSHLQPDWVLYTSDLEILNHPALQSRPEISSQLSSIKNKRRNSWAITIFVLMLLVASPILLYLSLGNLTGWAAEQVPAEWEEALGETVFAQYQTDIQLMEQQKADIVLQPLTEPLIAAIENAGYDYKIHIANDEAINAFALPGGYIVINSGLILNADNAEQLLGVVAHEISHVTQKHSMKNIFSAIGTYAVIDFILGDASGLIALAADAAPLIINQSYSRDFEREADQEGFKLLLKARINPQGLVSFFDKLKTEEQKRLSESPLEESAEISNALSAILSTHPATDERISTLNQLIEQNQQSIEYLDLQNEFEQLKAVVADFVTSPKSAPQEKVVN